MGMIIVQAPPDLKISHIFERIASVSGILIYIISYLRVLDKGRGHQPNGGNIP
jgi:hypothetical protein